ncbi:toll/interleukin-1 receptor domain-containing protein, partial [bacterium]|nr:toll/interleukin-1 receptor domain-containing protein [bacterium]
MSKKKKDFFISYNKDDKDWAKWIASVLEEAGYSFIIQARDIRPAHDFINEMRKALSECERMIGVLSKSALESDYVQAEWNAVIAVDPIGEKGKLLLVRVKACESKELLLARIFIDLIGLAEKDAKAKLLKGLEFKKIIPSGPQQFPGIKKPFPGALPRIWNITHLRNRNFTGRQEELVSLWEDLKAGKAAALVAIHGQGGVGKTEIAIEYAFRHAVDEKDYDMVFWVNSEETAKLASEYASLSKEIGLDKEGLKEPEMINEVRGWLGNNK